MTDVSIWPTDFDPRDPWDDDGVLFREAWRIHRRREPKGGLSKDVFRTHLQAFEGATREYLGGDGPFSALAPHAEAMLLDGPADVDPRGVERPEELADAAELCRVGSNGHPDLGSEAPGRILGPWEDTLERTKHAALLRAALAEATFIERVRGENSSWMRFRRRKPFPPVADRSRVRPVAHASVGVWTMTSKVTGGWRLADRVGFTARRVPIGPVELWDPVSVTDTAAQHGATLVGRLVPTATGWVCPMPFVMAGEPPIELIRREVQLILWRQRLVFPRVSREESLANAGHSLIRRMHEWAWTQHFDTPTP
ncbi:MAG: hypothetical protein KC912_03785 [Proteobacteria bacterium]|nr:hypothetical protein [Pseudomonadota bacterium]